MLSQVQMNSITKDKQAMPENTKYDGPGEIETPGNPNKFAANSSAPLPKPGFSG